MNEWLILVGHPWAALNPNGLLFDLIYTALVAPVIVDYFILSKELSTHCVLEATKRPNSEADRDNQYFFFSFGITETETVPGMAQS